ncbi:MAG: glycosyltransferase family 1 protein [Gallionella sp.]|nr:glycosyltransferase family 1 protein [Gallionella sp.]
MIRVAYDSQIFAQQQFGGISRYFCEVANRVGRTPGFESRVIAPLHRNLHLADSPNLDRGTFFNPAGRIAGKMMRVINDVVSPWCLRSYAPDILHETYYLETDNSGLTCARVVTVHDMINEKLEPESPHRDKLRRAKLASVSRADSVICVSEHTRRDLIELFGVPEDKTHVVYHGFTLTVAPRAERSPQVGRPFILYVGKRDGYKNFDTLLAAFASSARLRTHLALVAFGGGKFSAAENQRIAALGLKPSDVIHMGGQDDVLSALYGEAACFVYPSMYEGFGIPLLEAMGFGCPVVCSNTSSIPEVVGDAALTVAPDDIASMRDAVERASFEGGVRRMLISRGTERIRKFSWGNCAEETMKIYRELL